MIHIQVCIQCGEEFHTVKPSQARTCSSRCRSMLYRRRRGINPRGSQPEFPASKPPSPPDTDRAPE